MKKLFFSHNLAVFIRVALIASLIFPSQSAMLISMPVRPDLNSAVRGEFVEPRTLRVSNAGQEESKVHAALENALTSSAGLEEKYRFIDLKKVPLLSEHLGFREDEYRYRLVEEVKERGKGKRFLVKVRTQALSSTQEVGWPLKDDPLREYVAFRIFRAFGGNVPEIRIPSAEAAKKLARKISNDEGRSVDPSDVYLVRLTMDYGESDPDVLQKKPKQALSWNLVLSTWLRIWDFHYGNMGPLREKSNRRSAVSEQVDDKDWMMMFDLDESFQDKLRSPEQFTKFFIRNYFQALHKTIRSEYWMLRDDDAFWTAAVPLNQVTYAQHFLDHIDLKELSKAIKKITAGKSKLEKLRQEVRSQFPEADRDQIDRYFSFASETQERLLGDMIFLLGKIYDHDVARLKIFPVKLKAPKPGKGIALRALRNSGLEEDIETILLVGSNEVEVARVRAIAEEVFPLADIQELPLPLPAAINFSRLDVAVLVEFDQGAKETLAQAFRVGKISHLIAPDHWDDRLEDYDLREAFEGFRPSGLEEKEEPGQSLWLETDRLIDNFLREHPGGPLTEKELAGAIDRHPRTMANHNYKDRVRAENTRRASLRPPLPPIFLDRREVIIAALRKHPGGFLTAKQLAKLTKLSTTALDHNGYRTLINEENAARLTRGPFVMPITLTAREAIIAALQRHPGGSLRLNWLISLAKVDRKTLRNHDYRTLITEENARRSSLNPSQPAIQLPRVGNPSIVASGLEEGGALEFLWEGTLQQLESELVRRFPEWTNQRIPMIVIEPPGGRMMTEGIDGAGERTVREVDGFVLRTARTFPEQILDQVEALLALDAPDGAVYQLWMNTPRFVGSTGQPAEIQIRRKDPPTTAGQEEQGVPGIPSIQEMSALLRNEGVEVFEGVKAGELLFFFLLSADADKENYLGRVFKNIPFSAEEEMEWNGKATVPGRTRTGGVLGSSEIAAFLSAVERKVGNSAAEHPIHGPVISKLRSMKPLVILSANTGESQKTLFEETIHVLAGDHLLTGRRLYLNVSMESVNDLLQILFFLPAQLNHFSSMYTDWTSVERRAFQKRYLEEPGLNPNFDLRTIIERLSEDIVQDRGMAVDDGTAPILDLILRSYLSVHTDPAGYVLNRQAAHETMKFYLSSLLEKEHFSRYKPLFPSWKMNSAAGQEESPSLALKQLTTLSEEGHIYALPAKLHDFFKAIIFHDYEHGDTQGLLIDDEDVAWAQKQITPESAERFRTLFLEQWERELRQTKETDPFLDKTVTLLKAITPEQLADRLKEIYGKDGNILMVVPEKSQGQSLVSLRDNIELVFRHELGHRHQKDFTQILSRAHAVIVSNGARALDILKRFRYQSDLSADALEFWNQLLEPNSRGISREGAAELVEELRLIQDSAVDDALRVLSTIREAIDRDHSLLWSGVWDTLMEKSRPAAGLEESDYEHRQTDPKNHDDQNFTYFVHMTNESDAALIGGGFFPSMLTEPYKMDSISTSIIHRDPKNQVLNTFRHQRIGYILRVPQKNIVWVAPYDFASDRGQRYIQAMIKERDERGLLSFDRLIESSQHYQTANEAMILGTGPDGERVETTGLVIIEDPAVSRVQEGETSSLVSDAQKLALPIVRIQPEKRVIQIPPIADAQEFFQQMQLPSNPTPEQMERIQTQFQAWAEQKNRLYWEQRESYLPAIYSAGGAIVKYSDGPTTAPASGLEEVPMLSADDTDYDEEPYLNNGYAALDKIHGSFLSRTIREMISHGDGTPAKVLFVGVGRGNEAIYAQRKFGSQIEVWALNKKPGEFYDAEAYQQARSLFGMPDDEPIALENFRAVQERLRIADLENPDLDWPTVFADQKFDVVVFGAGVEVYLRDKVGVFNRLLKEWVASDGYLFAQRRLIDLNTSETEKFFKELGTDSRVSLWGELQGSLRFQNRDGFQIPLVFDEARQVSDRKRGNGFSSTYRDAAMEPFRQRWQAFLDGVSPANYVVVSPLVAERFPVLEQLARVEPKLIVDHGAETARYLLAKTGVLTGDYYGAADEAQTFSSLMGKGMEILHHDVVADGQARAQLRAVLLLLGIPEGTISNGMDELLAGMEELAIAA